MNVFDIVGPIMIGPSSSHTAGAVRIGNAARKELGDTPPSTAVISLYGSFAATYKGHATDKALIAGLLGFAPDDARIQQSLALAAEAGLDFRFEVMEYDSKYPHPNTAVIEATSSSGSSLKIKGESLGGGMVNIEVLT